MTPSGTRLLLFHPRLGAVFISANLVSNASTRLCIAKDEFIACPLFVSFRSTKCQLAGERLFVSRSVVGLQTSCPLSLACLAFHDSFRNSAVVILSSSRRVQCIRSLVCHQGRGKLLHSHSQFLHSFSWSFVSKIVSLVVSGSNTSSFLLLLENPLRRFSLCRIRVHLFPHQLLDLRVEKFGSSDSCWPGFCDALSCLSSILSVVLSDGTTKGPSSRHVEH